MALMLGQVYSSFGEHKKALRVAEKGLEITKLGSSYIDQSDAAVHIGLHMFSLSRQYPHGSKQAIDSILLARDFMEEWANRDFKNGYSEGEVQKCLLIADWENQRALQDPEAVGSEQVEQPWIERVKDRIPESANASTRNQLVDVNMRALMRQGRHSESLALSADWLEQISKAPAASLMQKAQAFLNASIQAQLCVKRAFQGDQPPSGETTQSAINLLWSAWSMSLKALGIYRQMNGVELILDCTLIVWQVTDWAGRTLSGTDRRSLLTWFVAELNETEKVCDDMRRSVLPVGGLQPLMNKRLLVSKKASLKLYSVGINLALELEDPVSAWLWLQKGKARAFVDSLGAKSVVPQRLLEQINNDRTAYGLLKKEQGILDLLHEPDVNYVIAARQLAFLRKQMEENALLAEASRLRDGLVKFVDWYVPSLATPSDERIFVFVRELSSGTTHSKQLFIKVSEVRDWLAKAFKYPDMATPPLSRKTGNRLLKSMNRLLDGLAETTSVDDLLILSPSGPLHIVPLHALDVGGSPLIQRNIVVYSSSSATLGQCLLRTGTGSSAAQNRRNKTGSKQIAQYFAVYEEPDKVAERTAIFTHIKTLPSHLSGSISLGPEVTKSRFLEQCAGANWIHYHGHARYSKDDVLKSCLILSDGTDIFSNNEEGDASMLFPEERGVDELAVSELFEVALPQTAGGVHFTIIACDSGTQDIAPGDEPLGIIPALLYAGATSVLGCLWPIDSRAGRVFSEAFYAELAAMQAVTRETSSTLSRQKDLAGECGGSVDLAGALRTTVEKMRKGELGAEFKQAYYWAPFALHGLWYLPLFRV
ncbi:CHAT domain-containing protein [Podospora didyma]|uniref:CHAT domain-containing protein n=1 Tax=Podospora didyma TaxID=330526 RepID=A0AAE0NXK2_9PEZI|nr:CHAT domain-containing protein [Podospora didyma]